MSRIDEIAEHPWYQWIKYAEDEGQPTETVYGYVPVEMVRALIELHGGEA